MAAGVSRSMRAIHQVAAVAVIAQVGVADVATAQFAPQHPFPQHIEYTAGVLRPSHRTQAQQDDDVRALYAEWKTRYLVAAGTEPDGHPRYRVRVGRSAGDRTVSEAQGYGLLITALMAGHETAAQTIFDGLLEFAKDHPSEIDPRLMDWRVEADEVPDPSGNDSAFDADADIAYALLLAQEQWGGDGRFDYAQEAAQVLAGLLESVVGPASRLPMLGDWVDPDGTSFSQWTLRTSDLFPDHFRAFERATGQSVWGDVRDAAQSTIDFVQTTYAPISGLLPDFLEPVSPTDHTVRPADPNFLEGPNDGAYYYNSTRVPLRLATDALLWGDLVSTNQVRRISLFIEAAANATPSAIRAGYALDGTPLSGSGYFTTAFAAPLGVAAMVTPSQQAWLNALYDAVRLSDENYYEDTLTLLSMLLMSGNFWGPDSFGAEAVPGLPAGGLAATVALFVGLYGSARRGAPHQHVFPRRHISWAATLYFPHPWEVDARFGAGGVESPARSNRAPRVPGE